MTPEQKARYDRQAEAFQWAMRDAAKGCPHFGQGKPGTTDEQISHALHAYLKNIEAALFSEGGTGTLGPSELRDCAHMGNLLAQWTMKHRPKEAGK